MMAALGTTIILCFALLLPFIPLARATDRVNIAAAYTSEINDGWARYLYWQQPSNNKIVIKRRYGPGTEPVEIRTAIAPKKSSHLAAHYIGNSKSPKEDNLVVWYLDESNQIIKHSCRHTDGEYVDDFTAGTGFTSASGLAAVQVSRLDARRYYIDKDDFVVEQTKDKESRLGPKAAKGSIVSATVPVKSTDILLFFIDDNMSLSSLKWDGSQWSEDLPALRDFTSDPKMEFTVAAWSDPLIVRVFYINKALSATEWTFRGGSWADTSDTMPSGVGGIELGQPVAASRSMNGTGRYLGFYYAAPGGQIKAVGSNADGSPSFQTIVAEYEVPQPPPENKLSPSDIGAIVGVLGTFAGIVVAVLLCCYGTNQGKRWRGKAMTVIRKRCKKAATEDTSSG